MRIVLDLATTWFWKRPPVGIVRAERMFAQFLLRQTDVPVAFCRYDRTLGRHVPVDVDEVQALLMPGDAAQSAPAAHANDAGEATTIAVASSASDPAVAATPPPRVPVRTRVKGAIKRAGHRMVFRLPEPLRPEALQTLRAAKAAARGSLNVARGYLTLRRWRRDQARRLESEAAAAKPTEAFRFEKDDVYFSMGLDWEYNNLEQVYRERRRVGFRCVLYCYDTIPVLFPHLYSFDARQAFARYFVDVAHTADRVVAISETSRNDFMALMRDAAAPQPPVDVVYLGTNLDAPKSLIRPPLAALESRPFALCVSTIEARKNHAVLYQAWERLAERHGNDVPLLVIVGMVGWGVADLMFRIRTNPRVKDQILILDNLEDGELAWVYEHCLFTLFPSLYEGWGLPVVESLALGKPCICSTAPAVAEAAQGMAIALDPLDTPEWVDAIERLWKDDAAREAASARLRREFDPQTWPDHGAAMIRVARAVAGI
jgi:glycosyltransferase involved in cell wall biosynthesis